VDWPQATRYLVDDLSQELIKRNGASKIIPRQTLDSLRRDDPELQTRSCRRIGEMAGAHQVLWLEVQDFYAEEDFIEPNAAAYFNVTVKVINALEKRERSRVRLWPVSPEGHFETAVLTGSEAARAKTKDGIARALAARLAEQIAKLFCDYRPEELERTP
jgi:hypothetical protein